jgi:TonB family protein
LTNNATQSRSFLDTLAKADAVLLRTQTTGSTVPEQSVELETCQSEQHPKPVFTPEPPYTEEARQKRHQALILLHTVIAADASVIDAQALNPTGDGLDVNARNTVLTWKFQPATCSGRPVSAEMVVEVSFKLF